MLGCGDDAAEDGRAEAIRGRQAVEARVLPDGVVGSEGGCESRERPRGGCVEAGRRLRGRWVVDADGCSLASNRTVARSHDETRLYVEVARGPPPTLTRMSRCGRRDAGCTGYVMHGMRRRRMRVARYAGGCVAGEHANLLGNTDGAVGADWFGRQQLTAVVALSRRAA